MLRPGRRCGAADQADHQERGKPEDHDGEDAGNPDPGAGPALVASIVGLVPVRSAPAGAAAGAASAEVAQRVLLDIGIGVRRVGQARAGIGIGGSSHRGLEVRAVRTDGTGPESAGTGSRGTRCARARCGPCAVGRRAGWDRSARGATRSRRAGSRRAARTRHGRSARGRRIRDISLERVGHGRGRRESLRGVGREGPPRHRLERRGDAGSDGGRTWDGPSEAGGGDGCRRIAFERSAAGEQLEQDDAQAVDVRGRGRHLAARLLGAEVVDRSERRAGQGDRGLGDGPGDPEVGHLDLALARHEHVARLDVAMDEPVGMCGGNRAGDLGGQAGRLAGRQGAGSPDDRGEVLAIDELHHDERAGRIGAVVVDAHDPAIVERGRRLRLCAEPGEEVGVLAVLGTQHLDRDIALELRVVRPVDRGHATLAEELDQAVAPAEDGPDIRQACLRVRAARPSPIVVVRARIEGSLRGDRSVRRTPARTGDVTRPDAARAPSARGRASEGARAARSPDPVERVRARWSP